MTTKTLKSIALVLLCTMLNINYAWGTTASLSFSGSSETPESGTSYNDNQSKSWTVTHDSQYYLIDGNAIHVGSSSKSCSYLKATSSAFSGATITSVVVRAKQNGSGTVAVTINGSAFGGAAQNLTNAYDDYTFSGSVAVTGDVVVNLSRPSATTKNFFLYSITITYTAGGSTCATPTFSPAAGTYSSTQSVTLSTETGGATIYYTTDGSTPTTSSSVYSSALSVSSTQTIKAFAAKSGMTDSEIATANYTIVDCSWFESFSGCDGTGGNDGSWSGSIASTAFADGKADNSGWTLTQGNAASGCIKLGSGSNKGIAQTPTLTGLTGTLTVKFRAAAWNGSSENTTLNLSTTSGTLSESSVTLTKGAWTAYTVTITGASAPKISFEGYAASNSRFFLDSVCISATGSTPTTVTLAKGTESGGTISFSDAGPLTTTSAAQTITVTGSSDGGKYLSGVTQSGASSAPTITRTSCTTYTITYPVGCSGTSTITPTFSAIGAPTQTFSAGEYIVGGSSLDLSTLFSSNSDGTVTYSVQTDGGTSASIVGSTFTASAAGSCTVRASQAADGCGFNAKTIDATITVSAPECIEAVYTIDSRTAATQTGTIPTGATHTFSQNAGTLYQLVSGNYMTLTLGGYDGKRIKSVTLEMKSNASSGAGTLSITAGSTTLHSISPSETFANSAWNGDWSSSYVDVVFDDLAEYNVGASENVVIRIESSANSLYCDKITVCWTNGDPVNPTASLSDGEYLLGGSALDLSTLFTSNSSGAVTYSIVNAYGTGATIAGTSFTATSKGTNGGVVTIQASQVAVPSQYNAITKTATVYVRESKTVTLSPSAPAGGTTSLDGHNGSTGTVVTISEAGYVTLKAQPSSDCYAANITISPEDGYTEIEQEGYYYDIMNVTKDLTIAVTYAQRTQYTITLDAGSGTVSPTSLTQSDCGSVDLPSATSGCESTETPWTFAGWSRTKVNAETTTPPVLIPAGSFTPTSSETLYAVYKLTEGTGSEYWLLAKDESKLAVGDSVIISSRSYYYAMSNDQKSNNRGDVGITLSADPYDTLKTPLPATIGKFVLQSGTESSTYAFYEPTYDDNAGGYLYAPNGSSNYLRTQGTNDENGSFTISLSSTDGVATIVSQKSSGNTKYLRYNHSSNLFSCYTSGTQGDVVLYVKSMGGTNKYISLPSCTECVDSEASLSSMAVSMTAGATTDITLTSLNTSAVSAVSSNADIVTVSVTGKTITITSVAEGEATITIEQARDAVDESGHCRVYFELHVAVTTPTIEIIEWDRESITIEYDGADDANVVLGKEVEHGSKTEALATELFFSKYFEAAGEDKLLGIYNGTDRTIDLTKYFIWTKGFNTTHSLASYGATPGQLAPKEELIIFTYGSTGNSRTCMDTIDGHEAWNEISWEGLKFSGRHSIGLYKKDRLNQDSLIDIIGATYYDESNPTDQDPDLVILNSSGSPQPSWGDDPGFNAPGCGDNIKTKDVETNYGLSTNRCLLIRKNTVRNGANAIAKDTLNVLKPASSNVELAAAAFQTLCEEWVGFHIPGTSSADKKHNTCVGMSFVAGFDYSDYYVTMETFSDATHIGDYDNHDGTYTIPIPQLDTLACKLIRLQLTKGGEIIASSDPKVPIVVDADMSTNSSEFYKHSIDTCKVCDVVVRDNSTLTKAANGAANDRAEVRNITVYSGSHLVIPSGATNMKASSIVLRSLDDTVSTASFVGGIRFKDDGYHAYHSKRVQKDRWYWFCLPHACRTNRITWQDGSLARLGTDFHLKYYDGEQRAATQSGGCWKEYTGSTIQPGVGYILSVEERVGHAYRELIFPMDTISEGETTKPVSVDDYGAGEDITPNHKGWNLVGNPYMTYYQKNTINAGDKNLPALTVGKLNRIRVDDPGDPTKHLLTYEILTDGVNGAPFVTVPVSNGNSEYTQVLLMDYDLPPFISYFVQIGDDAAPSSDPLYVNFAKADLTNTTTNPLQASYVRKRIQEMEDPLEPILVTLHMQNGKNESDETTLIISDLYSNDYEIGSDLGKMFGDEYKSHSKPVFYSKMEDNTKLAFRSMPDSAANEWTPLGFWGYNTQPITVSLRRNNRKLDYVESVMLYDKTMNTYTELLTDDYVLYPTKQGLFGSRLSVKVKVKRPTPAVATGMDEAHEGLYAYAAGNQQLVVAGIPEHATVWLYDALGKLIAMENTSHYMRTYTLPSSGVYFVRVNNEQGQRILRVIIK